MPELEGEIKNVIFRSEDTGYTVLDLKVGDALFTVVGTMPPVCEGQQLKVEGDFKTRSMYGRQFNAERVFVGAPSRVDAIARFLGSGLIKGLGPVTAAAIVDRYGAGTLEAMKYPIEIAKVRGISLRKATDFCLAYSGLQKLQSAVMFLQGLGLTVGLALKIYRAYGDATESRVRANPYTLVDDIDGVGFATADKIAAEVGIARDSDFRICAAVNYVLEEASRKFGHNYLPENDLLSQAIELLKLDLEEPARRIKDNIEDMVLLGELVRYDTGECVALLTRKSYNTEVGIAKRLVRLARRRSRGFPRGCGERSRALRAGDGDRTASHADRGGARRRRERRADRHRRSRHGQDHHSQVHPAYAGRPGAQGGAVRPHGRPYTVCSSSIGGRARDISPTTRTSPSNSTPS